MQRYCVCFIAAFLTASSVAVAQQNMDKVQIKDSHVAGNVYMLEGSGGNIGVSVGEDGILIVDDQFAPLAKKIEAALAKVSKGEGKLRFVLNTHWHYDHVGGNPHFGSKATIVAHENVRKRVMASGEVLGRSLPALPKEGWPVVTFEKSLSIHFNGEEIKVIHYPRGHTDGDSVVFFTGSNVVHMGDDFFSGKFPFVDVASGGSVQGLTANIRRIIEKLPDDVKIIPGHGTISTLDDLKAYHRMLVSTSALIQQQIKAGKSLDEVKADGLPSEWDSWGGGFIKTNVWIEVVYTSLKDADG